MHAGLDVYEHYANENDYPDLDVAGAAKRLSAAIRCKTIDLGDDTDPEPYQKLHELIRTSFPHVMAAATIEEMGLDLLITIPGSNPALDAALLLAHQDVVPAQDSPAWEHGPFEGYRDERYIWGRGALDIKDMLTGELEALEYLLSHGRRPQRTVILAFGHDEETISRGATALAAELKARGVRAAWLLDEGTTTMFDGASWGAPGIAISDICVSQKGFLNVLLTAPGSGGHSSNPFGGTSLEHMARAITAISDEMPGPLLNDVMRETFRALAPCITEEPLKSLVQDVDANADQIARLASGRRELYPFVATTMAADMLEGGSAAPNVMPGDVTSILNFRLLPGTTAEDVMAVVNRALSKSGTDVTARAIHETPAGRQDSDQGAGYAELKEALEHFYKDMLVVPCFVCGGTDAIRYEGVCDSVLRITPFRPTPEEESEGVHGTNERISRRTYAQGIRVLIRLLESTSFAGASL
ncbi:MAG: M20/M25/M40 family metallo-hydrolase [Tractidigestivibacter sp.]|jgi:carboxypeptidase PM20D1|uniref:M20/M25/M40 family metallo-hydrolase n=1 Tax=Tractidigestivibacter sp. TaxID=2847320 RepID=UPI003D8E38B6